MRYIPSALTDQTIQIKAVRHQNLGMYCSLIMGRFIQRFGIHTSMCASKTVTQKPPPNFTYPSSVCNLAQLAEFLGEKMLKASEMLKKKK